MSVSPAPDATELSHALRRLLNLDSGPLLRLASCRRLRSSRIKERLTVRDAWASSEIVISRTSIVTTGYQSYYLQKHWSSLCTCAAQSTDDDLDVDDDDDGGLDDDDDEYELKIS